MGYGGYHPYPRRFGGGKPALEVCHTSLNERRGTGIDATDPNSNAWLEDMAIARAIVFDGWECNQRLANQWDPRRVTDMLSRWETVFAISPDPAARDVERRAVLTDRWQRIGRPVNHGTLVAVLTAALGSFFVAVEYISKLNAIVHVPDNTYPWGTVVDGVRWSSTSAHVLVRLQKPTGASEADFYKAAGKVVQVLDPMLPAWDTVDWYRASSCGLPINVPGGPSAAGFYLDCPANLDNQVFD